MYFISKNIDIIETEHIHHEDESFFESFFIEVFDLYLLIIFIELAYFFDGVLSIIGIF
jgi:hypothetical protein